MNSHGVLEFHACDTLRSELRNVAIISSCFRREDFFIGRGARREHSLSYATDEATKSDEKSRRPNREVIIAAFLKKHRLKLLEFSKMSEEQLDQSIYQITDCLHFTNEALIPFEFWVKAANLVRDIDMDDIAFVTLAEFLDVKLWTGNVELIKGLAKKGSSNFITTDELHKLRILLE